MQHKIALSTTESEYVALTEGAKESRWLRGLIEELGLAQSSVTLFCDSQSAIHLASHQAYHETTKHIDVRFHFIREMIEDKEIQVMKIGTEDSPTDMLTKSLPRVKFKHCLDLINFSKG